VDAAECAGVLHRARERMMDKRNRVIEEVIKYDPEYKPPVDYKPRKFSSKIYIPINEYPGYNFIGVQVCRCRCTHFSWQQCV
jgi:hypothetical protein